MDILFVEGHGGRARSVSLNRRSILLVGAVALTVLATLLTAVWQLGFSQGRAEPGEVNDALIAEWSEALRSQEQAIVAWQQGSSTQVDTLTLKVGQIQARLMRLDALGKRVTDRAGLDSDEFNFEESPAIGGPQDPAGMEAFAAPELAGALAALEAQVASRRQQLRILDELFEDRALQDEQFVAGRPIRSGWLSSRYGYRSDPFTGKKAWHAGVDFAGREGSDIISVAAGVVTYAAQRFGYGNLVEVSHGNGLVTRYAHCRDLAVKVGQVVEKGQQLGRMGSSGRSTGPHVHFEVLQSGRQINPHVYIGRSERNTG